MLGILRRRPLAGFFAAAVLGTAFHYTWLARTGRIDMTLACAVTVALGSFYLNHCAHRERGEGCSWRWLLTAYLAVAFGVLLKGPIALLLPGAIGFAFLLGERALPSPLDGRGWLRFLHRYGIWWGVPLVLAISVPW